MKVRLRFGLLVLSGCFLAQALGCAGIKEMAGGFLGISIRQLEKARQDAVSRNFDYDYFTAYTRTLDALKKIKTYVYSKDIKKHLIAVYVSEEDTTPVGVFFKETGKDITLIEVASPSSFARDAISAKLFAALSSSPRPGESEAGSAGSNLETEK